MNHQSKLSKFLQSDWILSLLLLGVFFLTTGYTLGWDDQHLEIPLLKHLINPDLYAGDYYIESLKYNFTSFFYVGLSKLISVEQIPTVYFTLFIICRYFLMFWCFKIWHLISQSRIKAFSCVMIFILIIRVSEFLYRTFSHQEFALAIILGGIYFFFKNRLFLAAILLGIAANFHALYSIFPMFYVCCYLICDLKKTGWKKLILVPGTFILCALPALTWILVNRFTANGAPTDNSSWLNLFITACPQNFFYPQLPLIPWEKLSGDLRVFYHFNQGYIVILLHVILNSLYNPLFKKNKKALVFTFASLLLIILTLIFTYFYPNRFVIDLNLIRNIQFLTFLIGGFTVLLLFHSAEKGKAHVGLIAGMTLVMLKYDNMMSSLAMIVLMITLTMEASGRFKNKVVTWINQILGCLLIGFCLLTYAKLFPKLNYSYLVNIMFTLICCSMLTVYALNKFSQSRHKLFLKQCFILIPLTIFFIQYSIFSIQKHERLKSGSGFWQTQRSWEDMQHFVRENTPIDTMLLVPYNMEMGGFRIFSERKIVASYRDCGIIGFDYAAAEEWQQRIQDIYPFQIMLRGSPLSAIKNAITKYQANYIVFMRYAAPEDNALLERVYTNMNFVLYKVIPLDPLSNR